MKSKIAMTLILFVGAVPVVALTDWRVIRTLHIGGMGGWDYITVDSQTHRLYVPRSTHTMVIDPGTAETIADIPGQKRAHGVALVPSVGRGFISDGGGDGAIVVFDLKTNVALGSIVAQPDADGIIFDAASGRVLVVSGDKGVLMSLKPDMDPRNGRIETLVNLGGAPEFLASDGVGRVFVNLMDKNEVAVVDVRAMKVVARWSVAPGGAPVGMSMDTKRRLLFIGCRKPPKLIVMSADDGKVLADLPIGEGVDATKVDDGQAFASCRDGTLVVVGEPSPGKFQILQSVTTPVGARTMGIDATTHTIYLPTAEFEQPKAGATGGPAAKPDSFKIVAVGRASGH